MNLPPCLHVHYEVDLLIFDECNQTWTRKVLGVRRDLQDLIEVARAISNEEIVDIVDN